MFKRLLNPIMTRSFFLFGARGVGKTSWLAKKLEKKSCLWIDLLDEDVYERYSFSPQLLDAELLSLQKEERLPNYLVIDEVQRAPRLLNTVQKWIQNKKIIAVMTGSSARKLKRGSANMLGGRANSYGLFPLSLLELGNSFKLHAVLAWGALPEIYSFNSDREKKAYLKSYCNTYLKEEILVEQLLRKLPPFRRFLNILAQNQGKLINFEKFSRDIGVDNKTIQSYIEILEETYIGLLLKPHHPSIRKSQLKSPKFYFFDSGVQRQLAGTLEVPIVRSTSYYGDIFEAYIINEIYKINHYRELDYELSFLTTKNGFEIDLILSHNSKTIFIEIKSTQRIDLMEVKQLDSELKDLAPNRIVYISQDPKRMRVGNVECLQFEEFLNEMK